MSKSVQEYVTEYSNQTAEWLLKHMEICDYALNYQSLSALHETARNQAEACRQILGKSAKEPDICDLIEDDV